MNTLSAGHDAGLLDQVFVDRGLGLDQQDGAGDHQLLEVAEEVVALDQVFERAHRHVRQQVEVHAGGRELFDQLDGAGDRLQRFARGVQQRARLVGREPGALAKCSMACATRELPRSNSCQSACSNICWRICACVRRIGNEPGDDAGGFHSSRTPPTSKTTLRMFMETDVCQRPPRLPGNRGSAPRFSMRREIRSFRPKKISAPPKARSSHATTREPLSARAPCAASCA